jgi:hypothetical protein
MTPREEALTAEALGDVERRTARLAQTWLELAAGEIERLGPEHLGEAAAFADQCDRVLRTLERSLALAREVRATLR